MKPVHTAFTVPISAALISLSAHGQATRSDQASPEPPAAAAAVQNSQLSDTTAPAVQNTPADAKHRSGESALPEDDQDFLENAIQGSYAEIEGSQLALEKTEDPEVRKFAEHMIKDHGQMVKEASKLATEKGLTPPDGPSALQVTEITALKALTGGAFDAMYVNRVGVAAHESTVEMFEEATRELEDPDLKAMAEKTLPKLLQHLEMARALNEKQEKQ